MKKLNAERRVALKAQSTDKKVSIPDQPLVVIEHEAGLGPTVKAIKYNGRWFIPAPESYARICEREWETGKAADFESFQRLQHGE